MYPWPSFGTFLFRREERAVWQTDAGWVLAPSTIQQRPVGSTVDVVTATSIGSSTRQFEVWLEPDRLTALTQFLNTTQLFTDWTQPLPDSRNAYLLSITPQEVLVHVRKADGTFGQLFRTQLVFVSQDPT